jgi:hypothetical protein
MQYPSDPLKQPDYFRWLLEKNGIKDSSPSIAQSGLMVCLWELDIWAKENGLTEQETCELLEEFGDFHRQEMERDLDRHIERIGVDI